MNIFFSGIGGVGIGPLAEIAQDAGYGVQGSDIAPSLQLTNIQKRGIATSLNQNGDFLQECHTAQPIDWFIYTSSLPADHPELVLAKSLGIKTAKRDELLAHIIQEKKLRLIAVAGTHGKTTMTGMLIWALKQLNVPVSYSVGSTLSFGPSGQFDQQSELFIYECDEFDRNFLHFSPYLSVIPSIGYDHPDTYPTEFGYKQAFLQFIAQSNTTILWDTDAAFINASPQETLIVDSSDVIPLRLPGEHMRRNATIVLKALAVLGHTNRQKNQAILEQFPGTNRRFERLGKNLYSDYGHHPVEIAATLQMARELSDNVVLVYQPHQNVRQHEVKDLYKDSFSLATEVYWLPTYLSREDPNLPILTPQQLTANIRNKQIIKNSDLNNDLWQIIEQKRQQGYLVLGMGAGSIDGWLREHASNSNHL